MHLQVSIEGFQILYFIFRNHALRKNFMTDDEPVDLLHLATLYMRLPALLHHVGSLFLLIGRILYAKEASLSGLVLTNGQPRNGSDFKRISAYVTQDDVLYAFLTVWETIWLSAQLHLPPTISHEEKKR